MADPAPGLRAARAVAVARMVSLRGELADVIDSASSTTGDDEHDPEGATIGFERAQAQALLDAAAARLDAVDAALDRVSAGTYGRCTRCGAAIGTERLAARPVAEHCIGCAT